jgi:hypothetical protein
VLVAPVMLKERAVLLVYAHAPGGGLLPPSALAEMASLTAAAATAFARLISKAKSAPVPAQ